ncbi:hypothetical protein A8924_0103 [Saccharopolyspora erythraea NRRL 2338]|nr:hypothetical protein A8924_0103 [Saccharopolyspora erythraea NRRL 2338]
MARATPSSTTFTTTTEPHRESSAAFARCTGSRCARAPGLQQSPAWNTVRLEPCRATRREAARTPALASSALRAFARASFSLRGPSPRRPPRCGGRFARCSSTSWSVPGLVSDQPHVFQVRSGFLRCSRVRIGTWWLAERAGTAAFRPGMATSRGVFRLETVFPGSDALIRRCGPISGGECACCATAAPCAGLPLETGVPSPVVPIRLRCLLRTALGLARKVFGPRARHRRERRSPGRRCHSRRSSDSNRDFHARRVCVVELIAAHRTGTW